MKKYKNSIFKFLRISVSIILIFFLFRSVKWSNFISLISEVKIIYIIIAGLLYFSGIFFSVFRWEIILKKLNINVSILRAMRLYMESSFVGNFLPTSVGGDAYKYAVLAKDFPKQKKSIIGSMLLERGSGFLILLIVNVFLFPFFFTEVVSNKSFLLLEITVSACALFILSILIFGSKINMLFRRIFSKFSLYNRAIDFLRNLKETFNLRVAIVTSIYSIFFVLNILFGQIMYLLAFGEFINPIYLLFSISIIYVAGVLPISFNSIGITEGLSVFLYGFAGLSPEIALAVALMGRVCLVLANLSGGLLLLLPSTPTIFVKQENP